MFAIRKSGSQLLTSALSVFEKTRTQLFEALDELNEEIMLNRKAADDIEKEHAQLLSAEKHGLEVLSQVNRILGHEE